VSQGDQDEVAALLGRPPQGAFEVVVRDANGAPVVILNAPFLESTGGVRAAEAAVDGAELEAAHELYLAEREAAMPSGHLGPKPSGGVGGTRRGVKCLHAHLAWYLAGGADPVGRWTCEKLDLDPAGYQLADSRLSSES
jgi:hypothetical protein